jgi:hypothetical protein
MKKIATRADASAVSDARERIDLGSRAIRGAIAPYVRGYRAFIKRLRSEGFRVRWTSPTAPVQLQGHLPSGEAFYFRCRWSSCSLSIAPRGIDPIRTPAWHEEDSRWGAYEAGSLEADEAEAVFRELLASYGWTAK